VLGLAVSLTVAAAGLIGGGTAVASACDSLGSYYEPSPGPPVSGPDGGVWFTFNDNGVEEVGRWGVPVAYPYCLTTYGLDGMRAQFLAGGADGSMWFTDAGPGAATGAIGRLNPETGQVSSFSSGLIDGSHPWQIALGPDGNMWFTDEGAQAIGRVTPMGQISEFTAGINQNTILEAITAGPDGNVWFTADSPDVGDGSIGKITPSGDITIYPIGTGFSNPAGITAAPDGNIWFTTSYRADDNSPTLEVIGRITPAGQITLFTSGVPVGINLGGIVIGPDGNLYAAQGSTMLKVSTNGQVLGPIMNAGDSPGFLAVAADGNVWGAGGPFDIGTGEYTQVGPAASVTPPSITGPNEPGQPETCGGAVWSTWNAQQPSANAYSFDGYQWQLDGTTIAQGDSYTPSAADLGHQLACVQTVTYSLPLVTATATSAAVKVGGATGPTGPTGGSGATGQPGGAEGSSDGAQSSSGSGQPAAQAEAPVGIGSSNGGAASTAVSAPVVTALQSRIHRSARSVRFTFTHRGDATKFECALVRIQHGHKHTQAPVYSRCSSPKTYRHLVAGRTYKFYVRAIGPGGIEKPPVTRHFTLA
jgi:streptogramin lyase